MFGKAGRSLTATDPAPLEMIETVINLKPEAEWRPGMTPEKLEAELDRLVKLPGVAVPFSLVGAFWLIYLLGYNLSVAVWVGIIALAGVDAETGVVMLLYLDRAFDKAKAEGRMRSLRDLQEAVEDGAVKRIRPKMMTVMAILMGLLPIMWSHGSGADVMKRIAAPMVGCVVTSFMLELLIYPVIFTLWKWRSEVKPALGRVPPISP